MRGGEGHRTLLLVMLLCGCATAVEDACAHAWSSSLSFAIDEYAFVQHLRMTLLHSSPVTSGIWMRFGHSDAVSHDTAKGCQVMME